MKKTYPDPNGFPASHVAVVGMAGRFPGCDDLDGFWDLLRDGKDVHQEIPPSRFDIDGFYDSSGDTKNSTLTRYGCFLSDPGRFDNRFFNISPREAAQMDPLQRLFLTTTYEALEMAGYSTAAPGVDPSRVSTYFGQSTDDWKTINEQQGIQAHYLPATNRSFAPGRVSHHFKWGGSYYSVDTGCSSSATAVHLACAALAAGECDMAVVGGGNICVIPEYFSGFSKGSFLSRTGGCKTFSHTADGYCRGEAVGTVILKRLEDAVAANDNVLGVVAATARNTNAGEGSITFPGESAQKRLLGELLRKGDTKPEEVGLVEMHGTGTQAGDGVETNSVRQVLTGKGRETPLYLSALKANIGHGEAAAGISSLIKALLMLRHDTVPAQPGPCDRFSDLAAAGIRIGNAESIPRSGVDGKRKLIVNSFDAAGGNTSLLLQDGPARPQREQDPRTHHIVTCSAKTSESLDASKDRLRRHLEKFPHLSLADLGYTTTARRVSHSHRVAYAVESVDQLTAMLKRSSYSSSSQVSSLGFMFTGQSSQYTAMGATLYVTSPRFQRILNEFESLCSSFRTGSSFLDVIQGTTEIGSATAPQVQLALVALEIALAFFLQELGLKPTVVLGHSLGEYSALCVAGVLSLRDTLYLVHERATLLERNCTAGNWGMMAVPLNVGTLEETIQEQNLVSDIEVCCLNGPSLTVVGGRSDALQRLQSVPDGKGIGPIRPLKVPYAFHTSQLDCILPEFEVVAAGICFNKPSIPVVSTLTGEIVTSEATFNASYLVQQCRRPVDFVGALKTAQREGLISNASLMVEIGPHPVCTSLLSLCLPGTNPAVVATMQRGHSDWEIITKCVAVAYSHNQPVDWNVFHGDYQHCLSLVSDLPGYAFEKTEYWTPYQPQRLVEDSKETTFSGTTCLQEVKSLGKNGLAASFVSRTQEPLMFAAIQGHLVDDVAICPASLFIDMACGAAQALGKGTAVEFNDLQMTSPLVVSASNVDQTVHISAAKAQAKASSVDIKITSASDKSTMPHATCRVLLHPAPSTIPAASLSTWSQMQRLVQLRAAALTAASGGESCHKLSRALFYKLFDSIVEYSAPFRILENATLDGTMRDATAEIRARGSLANEQGSFNLDPFIIDALVHLPGFLLNCDFDKPKGDLHIAKSIGRVLVLEGLRNGTRVHPLTCYAAVTDQGSDGTTFCDSYLFNRKGELVAMVSKICFQKITRQTFGIISGRPVSSPNRLVAPVSRDDAKPGQAMENEVDVYSIFLGAVAATTGVSIAQVKAADTFEALGVDSHMAISIIAETNRVAGVSLPAGFFGNCPTISDAERELRGDAESMPSSPPSGGISTPLSSRSSLTSTGEDPETPVGKAILVQGSTKSPKAGTPLFLVADSTGSIALYLHLPPLPENRPIYVIESPFAHCPEKNTISIPSMAKAFIAGMRTIQPRGPYLIGGFSFASIHAYETAYQLSVVGERVLGLLLMDMYAPPPALPALGDTRFLMGGIPDGPMANLAKRLADEGLLKIGKNEEVHMAGSLKSASSYEAIPIAAGFEPIQTHIIWAVKGINENAFADEHDEGVGLDGKKAFMGLLPHGTTWEDVDQDKMALLLRSWFFSPREEFGPNGWEVYVGDNTTIHEIDGDHVSVLVPPDVKGLGQAIANAVDSCAWVRV